LFGVLPTGTDQNDRSCSVGAEGSHRIELSALLAYSSGQQDLAAVIAGDLLSTSGDGGEVGVRDVVNHQPYQTGGGPGEGLRLGIGDIARFLGGGSHSLGDGLRWCALI
jgi:hypothetical protein